MQLRFLEIVKYRRKNRQYEKVRTQPLRPSLSFVHPPTTRTVRERRTAMSTAAFPSPMHALLKPPCQIYVGILQR